MNIKLPYGERELALELPGHLVKQVLTGKSLPAAEPEEKLVLDALAAPIESAPLSERVRKGETVCIIVGDMTRLWVRYPQLLLPVLDELNRGGVPDKDIFILSATGDHREQTGAEHRLLVGPETYRRVRVYDHRAGVKDELNYLGETGFGTPVLINKRVVEADRVVLTGGIVYHFLAGWGGGKKAILPGVAARETIMKNHSLAFNRGELSGLNPAVRAGRMDGNPCSEDMSEGAAFVNPDFLVNCVMDEKRHRFARVVAGCYSEAHREGCRFVDDQYGVKIKEQAELVIASCGGYPKDIDFYQTYKTLYNAHIALKKGGTLLLVSESREGMGNTAYTKMFRDYHHNREREAELRRSYTIGGHMAYHAAVIAAENDILVYSSLPGEAVLAAGMRPVRTLEDALSFIRRKHGAVPELYLMPHAAAVLPRFFDE